MVKEVVHDGANKQEQGLLKPDTLVEHFRIMRPLGRGGMAEVYLARDTKLGRKVALKMIRVEALGSADALERFLFEARATARFDHPNIVTVYAVGEYKGQPYVALQYLEGHSLRERMGKTPMGVREAVRICLAVAEALKEAHANHILHRDLKPENVMLGADGRVRVVDFGLAGRVDSQPALNSRGEQKTEPPEEPKARPDVLGTPAYMAPEQWQEEETSGATDVWALGVMLYELIAGHRPYEAPTPVKLALKVCGTDRVPGIDSDRNLPLGLPKLLGRCLEKNPADRPVAAELVDLLWAVLHPEEAAATEAESPFRGLLPFAENHSHLFFGRETEVASFIERMRVQCLLPVVGPSGAGKSSFVQAGVIPRLRERGPAVVLSFRPGSKPFEALASRIVSARRAATPDASQPNQSAGMSEEDQLARQVRASPQLLNLVLHRLARQRKAQVVLFVDQLEELWALVPDEEERRAFLLAVSTAADDPAEPVRVIFTLREEFLSRLSEAVGVSGLIGRFVVLGRMNENELGEVLCRPLQSVGYSYDDVGLVGRMIQEVKGEPACLPLLQFAGQSLWEGRDRLDRKLLQSVYEDMGGVGGALARHADGLLSGLGREENDLARALLLRLVTAEGMRRVMGREALMEGLDKGAEAVLRRLIEGRLVTVRRSEHDEGSELELVHESLVAAWGRLRRWLDESRDERAFLDEVGQAAELWDKRGRRVDEVWQGEALRDAERAAANCTQEISERIKEFLDTGLRRERRRTRARRTLYATLVLVLAVFSAMLWFRERETAKERDRNDNLRRVAEFRLEREKQAEKKTGEALAQSRQNLAGLLAEKAMATESAHEGLLYAAAALQQAEHPNARGVLSWLAQRPRPRLLWQSLPGRRAMQLDFSPDGRLLAVGGGLYKNDGAAIFDLASGKEAARLGKDRIIMSVRFSPDGEFLATGDSSGNIEVWRSGSWNRLWARKEAVGMAVSWSPDGKRLLCGGSGPEVVVFDARAGQEMNRIETSCKAAYFVRSLPDDRVLFACPKDKKHGSLRIWDPARKKKIQVLREGSWPLIMGLSGDGSRLVLASIEDLEMLDLGTGKSLWEKKGLEGRIRQIRFSADGRRFFSAGYDASIRVWDADSGKRLAHFEGHEDVVLSLAVSRDGDRLASSGADGSLRIWDVKSGKLEAMAWGHHYLITALDFSSDGNRLFSAGLLLSLAVWQADTGETVKRFVHPGFMKDGYVDNLFAGFWSPDGKTIVTGTWLNEVTLWDADKLEVRKTLSEHEDMVTALAMSADGKTLFSGSRDRSIRVWDMPEGRSRAVLQGHKGEVRALAVSPDGKTLASTAVSDGIWLWDVKRQERAGKISLPTLDLKCLAFSSDGRFLLAGDVAKFNMVELASGKSRPGPWNDMKKVAWAATSKSGRLLFAVSEADTRIWDISSASLLAVLPGGFRAAIPPDGRMLVVGGREGVIQAWDLRPLENSAELRGHEQKIVSLRFSQDGKSLWSVSRDKSVRRWLLKTGAEVERKHFPKVAFLSQVSADGKNLLLEPSLSNLAVLDLESGAEISRYEHYKQNILMSVFSHDGSMVAAVNQHEGARLFLTATGKEIPFEKEARALVPLSVAFSEDDKILAVTGPERQSGPIRLIDTKTGKLLRTLQTGMVPWQGVTFSPDGKTIAVAGHEKVLMLDVEQGKAKRGLDEPHRGMHKLVYSPDGRLLAASAQDATHLWEAESGRLLASLDWAGAKAFSPDSRLLAVATDQNSIRLVDLSAMDLSADHVMDEVRSEAGLMLDGLEVIADPERKKLRLLPVTNAE
ncbi:MAG: protein kinase [Deltaproteobacteria bacterium]|nr:protein kinase [Deltaproteobacteria bacterium]